MSCLEQRDQDPARSGGRFEDRPADVGEQASVVVHVSERAPDRFVEFVDLGGQRAVFPAHLRRQLTRCCVRGRSYMWPAKAKKSIAAAASTNHNVVNTTVLIFCLDCFAFSAFSVPYICLSFRLPVVSLRR